MHRLRAGFAALLLGSVISSVPTSARADDAEARKHFKAGVAYLQDPEGERFEEAYAEFKLSYELGKSPKVLGNLGLCAMKLERDGEAIDAYTRYLAEVHDIDPDERKQITADLETLNASAVHVHVTLDVRTGAGAGTVSIEDSRSPTRGNNVTNVYAPKGATIDLLIRPGRHAMAARMGGRDRAKWEFDATPGSRKSHVFVIEAEQTAATTTERPSRTLPIVVTGIGVAALAAGGVLGGATLAKLRTLDEECPNHRCPAASYDSEIGAVRPYVRTTDFLLLGGGIVSAIGVIWLIALPSGEPASRERASRAPIVGAVGCTSTACQGALHMGF